jgi:hypothetical protein
MMRAGVEGDVVWFEDGFRVKTTQNSRERLVDHISHLQFQSRIYLVVCSSSQESTWLSADLVKNLLGCLQF